MPPHLLSVRAPPHLPRMAVCVTDWPKFGTSCISSDVGDYMRLVIAVCPAYGGKTWPDCPSVPGFSFPCFWQVVHQPQISYPEREHIECHSGEVKIAMRDAATPAVALESKEESHLKHLQGTSCSRFGCQWTLTRDRGCSTGSRQTQGLPSFCLFRCSCVLCVFLFSIPGTPSRLAILSGHPSLSSRAAGVPPGSALNLASRKSPCGAYATHLLRSE